ncbi:low-density lipoprotein receptor-related protein 4 [Armigeres subalbatus]|uniref:low-density lipoprotein receptor-related protein 4 n=1 Tax=Armigeres subalbatus TaxID=124917 RepID=UPI002ED470AE
MSSNIGNDLSERSRSSGRCSSSRAGLPRNVTSGRFIGVVANFLALLVVVGVVVCDEDTTPHPLDDHRRYSQPISYPGANQFVGIHKQYAAGKVKSTESRQKPKPNIKQKQNSRPQLPAGKLVLAPRQYHPPPFSFGQEVPDVRSHRKGVPIYVPPGYGTIYHGLHRVAGGERTDIDFRHYGHNGGLEYPGDRIFVPDGDLLGEGMAGNGDTSPGVDNCDIKCEPREFMCEKSCACIHMDLHCNGQADCILSEDEQDCEAMQQELFKQLKDSCEASGTHVICATTHTCIAKAWLCDGDDDCGDFTDETHCKDSRHDCSPGKFMCQNELCVPMEWVCDGDDDCNDQSDERNCTRQCTQDEFRCRDGSCISASFECDGEPDCIDESDENACDRPMQICPDGEFKCKGTLGGLGGPGGRCVLNRFRCDGDNDCGDWSDEEGCPKKQVMCTANEFKCDDGDCIPVQWRCDDKQDCNNGEDEKGCPVDKLAGRTCSPDEYTCKDGRCILRSWVCDGSADCKRGEDEQDCEIKCEINQFACSSSSRNSSNDPLCINQKNVCDGHKDCVNGEDEQRCPIVHRCGAQSSCEQQCITAYSGREECKCRMGFLLHGNGFNCTDIDECTITNNPVCSQECINTVGSFRCDCKPGYVLRPDNRTCKAVGGAVKLLMANRADIRQVSLSNNQFTSIVKGLPNAIALDYHYNKDLLFWTDVSIDVIKRSYLNGTGVRDVIKWGLESPGGLAVDWIHDLLFWTDSGTRRVEVSTFDGKLRAVIAANDLDKPRAIAVHPGKATIFWTDWGTVPKIEKSFMDGSDRRTIVSESIFWPNGLAIDYTTDRIYWADAKHVIESADFDGKGRKKILSNNLPHPFAMTLFEDSMYWTDWHTRTVSSANKVNGRGYRIVHEGLHFPMDIQSFHPSRQPDYQNRCQLDSAGRRGGCSHLCLPNRNHRRCACPIGLSLKGDQRTCSNVPDKLLLIARKKDIRVRQLDQQNPSKGVDMVVPLDGIKSNVAIDWCSQTNVIYWTDVGKSIISRAFINGSQQEAIIKSNLISPAGLALDWITDKIYWTDAGTNRIEVASTDGKQRTLLIWEKLDKPRDIVVHPSDGYMFWSDWGSNPLIERAGMDGTGRVTLVSENLQWPNGLALDTDNHRLYFVDGGTKLLEFVNFDGTGRNRLITDGLKHPFGLDVYDKKVYWTDWDTHSIQVADKLTGQGREVVLANNTDLMDIRVFHRTRKDVRNPCKPRNGGCSYICLLSPTRHTCACPIGIQLNDDAKTCKDGPSKYLIFAHRTDIRQVSLDSDYQIDVVLPLPPISNAVALDVDTDTGDVYWADTVEDVIMRSSQNGMHVKQVLSESMDSVDSLVIDSVGRKIYWADSIRCSIEVSELDGSVRTVLVWHNLIHPRGIALDYDSGHLFWSDWRKDPVIERADMDGEHRKSIVTTDLGFVSGLAVDSVENRIYWTDSKSKRIESCDFNGNSRKVLLNNLSHPYALTVTTSTVYWTDWITKALHSVIKINTSKVRKVAKDLEELMDVKVVLGSTDNQDNLCGKNNGGCSHLCLRTPGGYSCKCPTGLLMKDGSNKECRTIPEEYLLIALRSGIGRISLDTQDMFDVVLPIEGVHGVVALDYHFDRMYIFYADVNVDAIRRVSINDFSSTKVIVSSGLSTPNGIAVDWLADNLYWTDAALKKIEVSRLDGSCRKAVLTGGLDDPRSIILYPKRGFMFWTDWGQAPRIERAYMDGSERRSIIDSELGFPTGLAIDFAMKKLYWADAQQDRIEMCDFDGKRRTRVISQAAHSFGFTLTADYMYWTDWHNKSVQRAPKRVAAPVEEVRFGLRGALEIRSVSGSRQPHDWNPCGQDNGGCSHLCLFAETRYVCGCPDVPDENHCSLEPAFNVPIKPNDEITSTSEPKPPVSNGSTMLSKNRMHAQLVIIATAILAGIVVIIVITILVLIVNSKRKQSRKTSRSGSDVLTFTNPNYNGVDGLCHHHHPGEGPPATARNTIWKRLKYDRAQERVFEEKYLGLPHGTATTTLISPASSSQISSEAAALPV